jgi:hypothetical protein
MKNIEKRNDLDLADSRRDENELLPDEAILDLPDVSDIPGQEYIHPPLMGEFADSTISSADEEGIELLNDYGDNVTPEEKDLLRKSAEENPDSEEGETVNRICLDEFDEDNAPLNEGNIENDREGEDLDLPEAEGTSEEDL